jgi:L-fucose mutarotase
VLIGIHPLLTPDLLHALASMGHGDALVIADANFPAAGLGKRVVSLAGASAPHVLDAILTRFPLDQAVSPAVFTMEVIGDPIAVPPPVTEFAAMLARHGLGEAEMRALARDAFYERARQAFVIVHTGELRGYGNILLVKGVVTAYPSA